MKYFIRFTTCCLLAAFASLAAGCSDDEPDTPGGGGNAIAIAAKHALGSRTDNAGSDQSHSYRIVMSANALSGTAEAPKLSPAGDFVSIVLYAAPQDKTVLPEGTYTLVDANPVAGQGDLNVCRLETTDAQGNAGAASQVMVGGSVKVTHNAAGYKIEVSGQLSGQRTLSCTFEGEISFEKKPDPMPEYDIELAAQYSLGIVYSEVAEDLSSEFYLVLSDIEMEGEAEDPLFGAAGQYVVLDLCAIEREPLMLPEGTYIFTEEMPSDMTGVLEYSGYNTTDATGEPVSPELTLFSNLQAVVTYTDNGYKIDVTGTIADGRTFHATFEDMIDFVDGGGGGGGDDFLPALEGNVSTTFTIAEIAYRGLTREGTAHYSVDFYDNDVEQNFVTTNRLTMDLFTVPSENPLQQLTAGTYNVATTLAANTIMPGSFNMETLQTEGSYCEQAVFTDGIPEGILYGLIEGGTVEIAIEGGQYTVTADLMDKNSNTIQGTFTGPIEVKDKSFNSTLTGDKEVDLTGKTCELDYWADDYQVGGDNWLLYIYTPQEVTDGIITADGSEALQIELISPTGSFADGLPAGDYTVASLDNYTPGGKICLPGQMSNFDLYSSWYLGDFEGNAAYSYAPFVRGKVSVARSGDQYTITVDVYDDTKQENRITATWTGTPVLRNGAETSSARSAKLSRAAAVKHVAGVTSRTVQLRKTSPKHPRW